MAGKRGKKKKFETVRVGVYGVGRGMSLAAQAAQMEGVELVALCDQREGALKSAVAAMAGVTPYASYERFLEHDMDAVVLANYATEHAPAAVQALEAGLHVQSESLACKTMAEAVALVRAVERSGLTYMYAENYAYANTIQEMRRLYKAGEIGELRYAEGEYVHPVSPDTKIWLSPTWDHWRNWLPATIYCTHAMSPIMYVSRTRPVRVSGFVVPYDFDDPTCTETAKRSDLAGILMVQMDNGAWVKLLQGHLKGHLTWCRIYGNRGSMETLRHGDPGMLKVHKEPWDKDPGEPGEVLYHPEFQQLHDLAAASGHGVGDYFMLYEFIRAIRTGKAPYLDVYTGLQMTSLGILGYRSAVEGNCSFEVPSFRKRKELAQWENDTWSFDPADAGEGQPAPSVLGEIEKTPEVRAKFEKRARELRPDWYE
jgi:predicted dehydrogenase